MTKPPFEKIRSLVERRKLFEALCRNNSEITCKGDDDSLFKLVADRVMDGTTLHANLVNIERLPQKDVHAIGNFGVESERYFFSGPLKVGVDKAELPLNCDVFLLQRRATLRIALRPNLGLFLAITEFEKQKIYIIAHVSDISAGGARIYFGDVIGGEGFVSARIVGSSKDPGLKVGVRFKAVIHPPSSKNIDVICEVKHAQNAVINNASVTHYGIEFVVETAVQKNRLLALTMDLQRKIALQIE